LYYILLEIIRPIQSSTTLASSFVSSRTIIPEIDGITDDDQQEEMNAHPPFVNNWITEKTMIITSSKRPTPTTTTGKYYAAVTRCKLSFPAKTHKSDDNNQLLFANNHDPAETSYETAETSSSRQHIAYICD
jgi:hypothetical protein